MVTLPKVNYEFKTILKIEGHSSQNQENQPTYTHIEGEINKNKNYKNKQKTEPILNKKSKATGITTLVFIHKNRVTVTKATQYQYKNRHLCQWARQPRNKFTHSQCAVFFFIGLIQAWVTWEEKNPLLIKCPLSDRPTGVPVGIFLD